MRTGIIKDILITMGFMTRLGPVLDIDPEDLVETVKWMPLSGLVLGVVIVLPFYFGIFAGKYWIQSWFTVAVSVYLTRGLHFDGIADIADGAGPYPNPQNFWEIIKDSRSGVFGILALALLLMGQLFCVYYVYEAQAFGVVVWGFILGRLGCSLMCMVGKPFARQGQGMLFMNGADKFSVFIAFVFAVICALLLIDIKTQLLSYVFTALGLFFLYTLAKKVDGANGDFLGAAVILAEISGLISFVASH